MRGTPLPGSVRSTIALGLPLRAARQRQRADDRRHVVAVDLERLPAEGAPFVGDRLHVEHDRAVGLDAVAVDQRDEAVELEMARRHRGFPGRALLHLAVREFDEDARRRSVEAQAERLPDALPQAMAERAADHLDAGRGVERRHLEPAVVGAVGGELVDRQDAGLGQRRPERDRIVAGRQQEAVAVGPVEVLRIVAQLVEVERGQRIGDAEALADIALPLAARHGQHVAAQIASRGASSAPISASPGGELRSIVISPCRGRRDMLSRSAVM